MVWILEDQGWSQVMTNMARLRTDQAADNSEEGAFAAAIAANEHPKSRARYLETAAVKSFCAAGPAVAHSFEPQPCPRGLLIRAHAGSAIQREARALAATRCCCFFVNLHRKQIAGQHTEPFSFNLLAGEFEQSWLPLLEGRPHLLIEPLCSVMLLALHGHGHGAHA